MIQVGVFFFGTDNLLARIETQVATNWKLSESTLRLRRSSDLLLVLSHVFYIL